MRFLRGTFCFKWHKQKFWKLFIHTGLQCYTPKDMRYEYHIHFWAKLTCFSVSLLCIALRSKQILWWLKTDCFISCLMLILSLLCSPGQAVRLQTFGFQLFLTAVFQPLLHNVLLIIQHFRVAHGTLCGTMILCGTIILCGTC